MLIKGNIPHRTGNAILDLILPRCCIVCGSRLLVFEKHICTKCLADLPFTFNWSLSHNPMADKFNELIQRSICQNIKPLSYIKNRIFYSHATSLFFFNSEAGYKKIPYSIKYHGDISSGLFFGRLLGSMIAGSDVFKDIDIIIPVPLHWSRKWKRGYNQAEIIARGIAQAIGSRVCTDILYRRRHTVTQTRLSVEEKSRNVRNAFGIKRNFPPGVKHVLLVDDVFTTGATLHACYLAIKTVSQDMTISIATLAMVSN